MKQIKIVYLYYKIFPRPLKETVKNLLFTFIPFFFKRWEVYQNWKYGRIFRKKDLAVYQKSYWVRKLNKAYKLKLKNISERGGENGNNLKLAVVVHVFYPEIFEEILKLLRREKHVKFSLYLTGTKQALSEIKELIQPAEFPFVYYLETSNHGRDILPFLKVLPKVFEDGYNTILKLHTKGSNHLNRKEHWRKQLFSKLIGRGSIENALKIFDRNPEIGMIGPAGNILPMSLYYASNGKKVMELCLKMGLKKELLNDLNFVAGSMFYARREVLEPVLNLGLTENDFEAEAGQTDGTMAHAVERVFSAGLIISGMQLADTDYTIEKSFVTVNKINIHII